MCEWIAALQLIVHNDGVTPTCVRVNGTSYIDLTITMQGIAQRLEEWRVTEEESLSEHRHTQFNVREEEGKAHVRRERQILKIERGKLKQKMGPRLAQVSLQNDGRSWEKVTTVLKNVQTECTRSDRNGDRRVPYWWNGDIEEARNKCIAARRRLTRTPPMDETRPRRVEELKYFKRTLAKAIKISKRTLWRELWNKVEDDVWADRYRIAVKHLKGVYADYGLTAERKMEIVEELFPQGEEVWDRRPREESPPQFTGEKLKIAAANLRGGTAPGLDGVSPETVKDAVECNVTVILDALNELLRRQDFPREWKIAKVVLLLKGDKPQDES